MRSCFVPLTGHPTTTTGTAAVLVVWHGLQVECDFRDSKKKPTPLNETFVKCCDIDTLYFLYQYDMRDHDDFDRSAAEFW